MTQLWNELCALTSVPLECVMLQYAMRTELNYTHVVRQSGAVYSQAGRLDNSTGAPGAHFRSACDKHTATSLLVIKV